MSYDDQEYHRRRSEIEMEHAIAATASESAVAHLELARMHRARRQLMMERSRAQTQRNLAGPILRADKEA
jgi:hypothetical protein